MKKKQNFLCYILIIIFIGCSNVFAKSTLLTCNYTKPYDSLGGSPGISVLCEIYSDYSHQCYGEVNNGNATNKSTKYKIENWTKKIKLDWTAKEYVKSNNKCPDYLGIYFGDKIGGLYAGATEEEAKQIASSGFMNGVSIYVLPESSISVNPEKIEKAREKIQQYTDHMNKFVNGYNQEICIEENKTIENCKNHINASQSVFNTEKSEVENYVYLQLIGENDYLIVNYNSTYSSTQNFIKKALEDLEKKRQEDENIKKDKCEDYTYNQCVGKTDINGNSCIRDNNVCRKEIRCSDLLTENECSASKVDLGKCKWNNDDNTCESYNIKVCTDYNDKNSCPNYGYDQEGNICYWDSTQGCSFLRKKEDSQNAREDVDRKTDYIRKFIDDYSRENYNDLNEIKKALNDFEINIKTYKQIVDDYVKNNILDDNDFSIINFNGAYSNALNFLSKEYTELQLEPVTINPTSCAAIFTGDFGKFLKQIYSLIKFAVPIIILGFAIIDFIKAIASGDPAEIKKAATKLVKRLAIGIAIFVLPTLVELILAMAGVEFGTCGIS